MLTTALSKLYVDSACKPRLILRVQDSYLMYNRGLLPRIVSCYVFSLVGNSSTVCDNSNRLGFGPCRYSSSSTFSAKLSNPVFTCSEQRCFFVLTVDACKTEKRPLESFLIVDRLGSDSFGPKLFGKNPLRSSPLFEAF